MEHSEAQAPQVTWEQIMDSIEGETYTVLPDHRTTICQLTLLGGRYTVDGHSACVSPENFNAADGRKYSKEDATRKIWPLLGFSLAQKLHYIDEAAPLTGALAEMNKDSTSSARTYVGTKVVHAIAMSRGGYNALRGWTLPDNENGEDEGFLVQYADGGKPNMDGFTGYVSWTPRDIFERAYKDVGQPQVKTWFERLIEEARLLNEKVTKLDAFLIQDPPVAPISTEERNDLLEQLGWMRHYLAVLDRRIDRALNVTM